jgi:exosome complex component RRP41
LYPRTQIDLYLHVLQEDGGMLHASMNAATLALINAGIPMLDYLCAINVGYADQSTILDLNRMEEMTDTPNVTVAMMPKTGQIVTSQMESKLPLDQLGAVLDLATAGCQQIRTLLDDAVRSHMVTLQAQITEMTV